MAKIHKISTAHLSIDRLQQIIENGYKLELSGSKVKAGGKSTAMLCFTVRFIRRCRTSCPTL